MSLSKKHRNIWRPSAPKQQFLKEIERKFRRETKRDLRLEIDPPPFPKPDWFMF
jgi:hypothetical protein